MPDQPHIEPLENKPITGAEEKRGPAIRTMKSDVSEYLQKSKPSLAKIVGLEVTERPARPQRGKKIYLAAGGVIATVLLAAGAALFVWQRTSTPAPDTTAEIPKEPAPPFAVENSRTVAADAANRPLFIRLMEEAARERERDGTITRLVLKLRDGPQERFATLQDFFALYRIEPPPNTFRQIEGAVMPFLYHGGGETRWGVAARTHDTARTLRDLLLWESSLAVDLLPLFAEQNIGPTDALFEDRTYRNIDWRFLRLIPQKPKPSSTATTSGGLRLAEPGPEKDIGIGHAVFPARSIVVITTSKEAMETVLDRLFNNR